MGPLIGGYLVDAVSWRAIFLINLPLGALVIWASRRHVPETRDVATVGRLDIAGSVLASVGLAGVTFALIGAGESEGMGTAAIVAGLVGIAALVGFVVVERRSPSPMLPLGIFASRQFTAANLVTFVVYAALGGVFFLLVLFLQVGLGYSAIAAGAATLPMTVLMLLLSTRAGALAQRIGPRLPLTIGPLLLAVGMLGMGQIQAGESYVTAVLPAVVVFGLGLSLVVAPVTATVLAAADASHAGIASGVNNAVARSASLVAVAALPAIAGLSGDDLEQSGGGGGRVRDGDDGDRRPGGGGRGAGLGHDPLRRAGDRPGRVPPGAGPCASAPLRGRRDARELREPRARARGGLSVATVRALLEAPASA